MHGKCALIALQLIDHPSINADTGWRFAGSNRQIQCATDRCRKGPVVLQLSEALSQVLGESGHVGFVIERALWASGVLHQVLSNVG